MARLPRQKSRARKRNLVDLLQEASGKRRIPYNDAVEEALCYGWIDSTIKRIDDDRMAQRFSLRRAKTVLSETNRKRVRRLIKAKKMTRVGLKIQTQLEENFTAAEDIIAALKKDQKTWKNSQSFPESYQRVRLGWIDGARHRPEIFRTRLRYFLKMTAQNKRFGMVQ